MHAFGTGHFGGKDPAILRSAGAVSSCSPNHCLLIVLCLLTRKCKCIYLSVRDVFRSVKANESFVAHR